MLWTFFSVLRSLVFHSLQFSYNFNCRPRDVRRTDICVSFCVRCSVLFCFVLLLLSSFFFFIFIFALTEEHRRPVLATSAEFTNNGFRNQFRDHVRSRPCAQRVHDARVCTYFRIYTFILLCLCSGSPFALRVVANWNDTSLRFDCTSTFFIRAQCLYTHAYRTMLATMTGGTVDASNSKITSTENHFEMKSEIFSNYPIWMWMVENKLGAFSPMNDRMEFIKNHYTIANAWKLFVAFVSFEWSLIQSVVIIYFRSLHFCHREMLTIYAVFAPHSLQRCSTHRCRSFQSIFHCVNLNIRNVHKWCSVSDTKCTQKAYMFSLWMRVASKRPVKND